MSAPFPKWSNTVMRLALGALAVGVVGGLTILLTYTRSPFFTGQFSSVQQPIQFDHRHHVADNKMDCRYCHSSVETSSSAGYPATALCLNCHAQVWNKAPLLDPLRAAFFGEGTPATQLTGGAPPVRPIVWKRVHRVADYVYFNHSAHVNKGVGCVECHGRVDRMAEVTQLAPLSMGWCLDCHRDPAPHLRPKEFITSTEWDPPSSVDRVKLGQELAARYDVHPRQNCTTCHR